MDFVTAFMIGFLGSLHCVGMCGPIALALPLNRVSIGSEVFGVLLYNSGRIITYGLIGLVFGLLGKNIAIFGIQQYFSIGLGVLIIASAILPYSIERLFDITPFLTAFLSRVKQKLGFYLKRNSSKSLFGIGVLNGLLPCGLVYFAIIGAIASYEATQGALFMMVFGLGTLPMMLLTALSPGIIGVKWRNRVKKVLPFFAIIIGVLFILRGLNLGIPYVSPQLNQQSDQAVECHEPILLK